MATSGSSLFYTRETKDDWSKICDQHERRKVQNRLAQRAYRQRKLSVYDVLWRQELTLRKGRKEQRRRMEYEQRQEQEHSHSPDTV